MTTPEIALAHPLLASRLFDTPLLVEATRGAAIVRSFVAHSARIDPLRVTFDGAQPQAAIYGTSRGGQRRYALIGRVAVVSVYGALANKVTAMEAECDGLMSYEMVGASIADAVNDPNVDGILLDIDSPGGEASGAFDLADSIAQAAEIKPIWASVNAMACSAGYLIAAAADRIYMSQLGMVGSVGAVAMHFDVSKMYAEAGVAVTIIKAGERKAWFSPYEPLAEAAQAQMQASLDFIREEFISRVATWRNIDAEVVRATEAGVYDRAQPAIDSGFVTGSLSFDDTLELFDTYLSLAPESREEMDMALFGSARTAAASAPTPQVAAAAPVAQAATPPVVQAAVGAPAAPAVEAAPALAPQATVEQLAQVAIEEAARSVGIAAAATQLTRIGANASIAAALTAGLSVEAFRSQVITDLAEQAEASAPSAQAAPSPGLNAPEQQAPVGRSAHTVPGTYATRDAARKKRLAIANGMIQ